MLPDLDPLLHSQLRLKIISLLAGVVSADFTYLLEKTGASRGNLSVQLKKLEAASYVSLKKSFGKSYPITTCRLTGEGRKALEQYVENLTQYLNIQS